jgi:hypothetical protein
MDKRSSRVDKNIGQKTQLIFSRILKKKLFFLLNLLFISSAFSFDYNNLVAVVQQDGKFIYSNSGEIIGEVMPYTQLDVIGQYNNFWQVLLPTGKIGLIDSADVYLYESNQIPSFCNQFGILRTAYSLLGIPYITGGTDPSSGFDCSGFVYYVFSQNGIKIPRTSSEQFRCGIPVRKSHLLPGDLVFFAKDYRGVSHVGIYWGGDYFIHSSPNKGVIFTSLSKPYYKLKFVGARRI